jgi:ketosteroid isomerase-like protein
MRPLRQFSPVIVTLLIGCASAPITRLNDDYSKEKAQIQRRLSEIFNAAEKKDFPRLDGYHLYGPHFTKFSPEAAARLDAEAARKGEHDGLAPLTDLSMKADDLKIDVFGDFAIVTFVFDYSFKAGADTLKRQALSTMVFVKDGGEWKITHEHFSAMKANP